MRNLKRLMAMILVVLSIFAMAVPTAMAEDPEKIVFAYMTQNNIPQKPDRLRIQNLINEWTIPNINVEVELVLFSNADYLTQVILMLASGEQLDIFRAQGTANIRFIKDGSALDLTPYLDNELKETVETLYPNHINLCTAEGKVYGLREMGSLYVPKGWTYRSDIIDELGIDLSNVTSVYDLTDVFAKVKEAYPDMIIIDNTRADGIFEAILNCTDHIDGLGEGTMANISGVAREGDPTVINIYETEEFRKACELSRSWYEAGYFAKDAATTTATAAELLMSGNCLSIFVGLGNPKIAKQYSNNYGYPFENIRISDSFATGGTNDAWFISSMSKHPSAAAKFLNLLYTNEYIDNLLVYGEEGVDYVWDAEHAYVIPPEGYAALNDVPYTCNMNYYYWGSKWLTYRVPGGLSADEAAENKRQNYEDVTFSEYYGFMFDYSEYEAEYTACKNVVNEYKKALWTGSLDVDTALQEMNSKLYASGLQTLLDAKQEQLTAWLSYK
jgi:putative aldouronate transport system substrate-binding protein